MNLKEAKQFLNNKGYVLVEKMTDEERNAKRREKYAAERDAEKLQKRAAQRERNKMWALKNTKEWLENELDNGLVEKAEKINVWYDILTKSGLGKITYMTKLNKLRSQLINDETYPEEWFEEHGISGETPREFTYSVKVPLYDNVNVYDITVSLGTDTISSYKLAHQSEFDQSVINTYAAAGAPICTKLRDNENLKLGPENVVDLLDELVNYKPNEKQAAKLADVKKAQAKLNDEIYNFEKGLRYHGT